MFQKTKKIITEHQILNPEKNEQNSPKSGTQKVFRDFSGNIKIYLANEVPIPTSHLINQTVGTNPSFFMESSLLDVTPPHMKNMAVEI